MPRWAGRFGYEYFEKLSTVAVKGLFVEPIPAEPAGVLKDGPPEGSELGVITLGVNEVRSFNGRAIRRRNLRGVPCSKYWRLLHVGTTFHNL